MNAAGPSRAARWIARSFAAGLVLIGVASCTSLLKLDDYQSASVALCGLLDKCYPPGTLAGCQNHVDVGLAASEAQRAAWLKNFHDAPCLLTCETAKSCLDMVPVCQAQKGACDKIEDCCGFLGVRADCSTVDKLCCRPLGGDCAQESDCCPDTQGKPVVCNPKTHACGGDRCVAGGQMCQHDRDCCTQKCVAATGTCLAHLCGARNTQCKTDDDCCPALTCDASHTCVPLTCGVEGTHCASSKDCCGKLLCKATAQGQPPICTSGGCSANAAACAADDECCSGSCDPISFTCSTCAPQATCSRDADCCGHGRCDATSKTCCATACTADADCCAPHSCIGGACAPPCNAVDCAHDLCSVGGPLGPSCGAKAQACITAVCAKDPFCCCGSWDALCVSDVLGSKAPECANPCSNQ